MKWLRLSLILFPLLSCTGNKKFDAEIWKHAELSNDFRHRPAMALNLIKNHSLKGKSYTHIVSLLGKPDEAKSFPERDVFYTNYTLEVHWDKFHVHDPVIVKQMVFEFGNDSLVQSYNIEDRSYLLDDL